jgi:hypothetical protein
MKLAGIIYMTLLSLAMANPFKYSILEEEHTQVKSAYLFSTHVLTSL